MVKRFPRLWAGATKRKEKMSRIVITNADWQSMFKKPEISRFINYATQVAELDDDKKFGLNTSFGGGIGVEYLYIPDHDDLQILLNKFEYAYLAHAADVLATYGDTRQDDEELKQMIIDAQVAFEIAKFQGGQQ